MIFTERQITVHKGKATIDEPVILYRGDYEVSIKFTIMESKFKFKNGINLAVSEKATRGQLAILAPYGGNVFSEIVKCEDGTVTFTLTKEMIDQLEEVGLYSFQIRLFDYYRESRVSIPPVEFGIEVREPVASEDHDNEVNNAIVGYSIAKVVDGLNEDVPDTFDNNGQYNKTNWKTGDRISQGKLNKIEDALDKINQNEMNDIAAMDKKVNSNFNVLDSKIDQKRDKSVKVGSADLDTSTDANKIQLNNLSSGVIKAISGNAEVNANVANGSLTEEKYADNSITDNKVKSFVIGKNLFNKDTITLGKFVTWDHGTLADNNNYWVSSYISVLPNTEYTRSYIDQLAFYDAGFNYISGKTYTDPNTIMSPSNACYVRVCAPQRELANFQFEMGNSKTTYEDYRLSIDNLYIDFNNTAIEPKSINSLMHLDILDGYITGASGCIRIDTKAKTMNIVSNQLYVSNYLGCYYVKPGEIDLSDVDFDLMVFIFFDINTNNFVFFSNGDYEHKQNLLFITCLYKDVVSNNQHAFVINEKSPLEGSLYTLTKGIDFNSIPLINIKGMYTGKNLFNPNDVTLGIYWSVESGIMRDNSSYLGSGFIPVKPNTTYYRSRIDQICCYDHNVNYVAGFDSSDPHVITTPDNCYYIKVSMPISDRFKFQLEEGDSETLYEPYYISNDTLKINTANISPNLKLPLGNIEGAKLGKNMFNKDTITLGKFVTWDHGTLATNDEYFTSDFIEVEPDTTYCRTVIDQLAFYNASFNYISGKTYTDPIYFTTPSDAKYIRVCANQSYLPYYQVELGESPTPYEPFGYQIDNLIVSNSVDHFEPLCTLRQAWEAWRNNEKFAIGFLGDSTTDGVGTSGWSSETGHEKQDTNNGGWGTADYICTKSYSYVLEQLIKEEMKTENPRIYNIGYSGTHFNWIIPKLEAIFSGVYSDVKMVGLVHGINDRLLATNHKGYSEKFTSDLETVVKFLLERNIQPFMVTCQAVLESGTTDPVTYPNRTSESINSVANKCKYEVAKKYGLEVLDMNSFGELILSYSKYNCTEICKDKLHFGDIGHKLEAGYLFSEICPRTIEVNDTQNETILSYTSQNVRCDFSSNNLSFVTPFIDGFKIQANYTKSEQNDMLIMDFWVMNSSKGRYELTVHVPKVNGVSYVRLDGVDSVIQSNGQSLGELEIGLHHIQMFTGASTDVSCYGFKMKYKG